MSGAWSDEVPPYLVVGTPGGNRIEIGPGADLRVIGTDGSVVELTVVGTTAEILALPGGGNATAATILSGVAGGSGQPQFIVRSPQQTLTLPNDRSSLILTGANATIPASSIQLSADSVGISGLAGTTGAGSAGISLGGNQGSPATANIFAVDSSIGMDGGGLSIANNVTVVTGTIDLAAAEIDLNFVRARMQVWAETYPLNGPLTLTGVSQAIVFGASTPSGDVPSGTGVITVTTRAANARYEITLWTDVQINTAGDTSVADLLVDGSLVPSEAIFATAGATGRATVSQGWQGQFAAAGTHTFQATGKRAAGAGAADVFNAVHTKIRVNIYE